MFDGLIVFLDEQPITAALIASLLLFALGQLLSLFVKKASTGRKKRSGTSTVRRQRQESNDPFSDYLSDFRILEEPEPGTVQQSEPVTSVLTIGYELNQEWVTVSYEGQDVRIGNGAFCELRLPAEDGVRELHAIICKIGTQFYLQPNQKCSVSLNGKQVKKSAYLSDGAVVTLGIHKLQIFLEE